MDVYSLKRQEAGFEALLRAVAEVLLKHVEPDTVAHCARTVVHCSQHGPQAIQVLSPSVLLTFPGISCVAHRDTFSHAN